ncbi:MAG: (d)CMP kinase [Bacteroidetes bacterium]|nr:(d)CMP kinase [Bacteroidota bacterium]
MALDNPVIAIDGFSSCGKSTVAKALAHKLGIRYIDSGAMYRAVTYYFLNNKIAFPAAGKHSDFNYEPILDKIHISFKISSENGLSEIYLNNVYVEKAIRSMEVSENVSHVSAIKQVRRRMVDLQKQMKQDGGLVMDGRDIGTTVFPEAELKIFMTADPEVRALRRFRELQSAGVEVTLEEVRNNINSRDYEDTHREESPLRKADDAIELDNTQLNFEEQVAFVIACLRKLSIVDKP